MRIYEDHTGDINPYADSYSDYRRSMMKDKKNEGLTFIDLFAGIGGFRRGMELAGHKCLGYCEWDRFASASYRSMHTITDEQREYLSTLDLKKRQKEIMKEEYLNGEWYADDIRTVYAGDIPKADVWCLGFPCQDISVAGKQVGFYGNRSSLFFRVMYLLGQQEEEKRPIYLFIENVKNLLSVNGGWDFARLLVEMEEGGYDAEWDVLNSKHFGVPQNRERCFIIGHLRGRSTAEIFPVEGTNTTDYIYGVGHRKGYRRNTQIFEPDGITEALDTGQGGGRGHHTIVSIGKQDAKRHSSMDIHSPEGIMSCLDALHEPKRVAVPVLTPDRANKRQNGRRFKEDGEEAFTLTGQDRHGVAVEVEPMQMSGYKLSEGEDEAHALNCSDQRKVFGANQKRTMVGYNATLKRGGDHSNSTDIECKRLQRAVWKQSNDDRSDDVFAIDKGINTEEREVANCIEAREDRGLSRRKQEGTLICRILECCDLSGLNTENKSESSMKQEN